MKKCPECRDRYWTQEELRSGELKHDHTTYEEHLEKEHRITTLNSFSDNITESEGKQQKEGV